MNRNNDVKQLWVGLAMIVGAIVLFVVIFFFGYISFYPVFLLIAGVVAVVRGFVALGNQSKQPALPPGMYMGPQQPVYPGQLPTYPGQQPGYPPQQPTYPGQQPGYPPQMAPGYSPQQPGYPPQQMGGYGGYAPPSQGAQPNPYGMPASQSQQMFGNSRPCWNCGQPVVGNPATCPSCGAPQSTPTS